MLFYNFYSRSFVLSSRFFLPFHVGPWPFPKGSLLFLVSASLLEQDISPSAQVFRLYQNSHNSLEKDLFPVEFDSTDPGIVSNYPFIEALLQNFVMRFNGCFRAQVSAISNARRRRPTSFTHSPCIQRSIGYVCLIIYGHVIVAQYDFSGSWSQNISISVETQYSN